MENDNENGGPTTPNSRLEDFSDIPMDLDFMDEIFFDGCWVETTDSFDALQMDQENPTHPLFQQEKDTILSGYVTRVNGIVENFVGTQNAEFVESAEISGKSQVFQVEGSDSGKRLWIEPRASSNDLDASLDMKERLMMAVKYLTECTKGKDVLIQIWVPIKRGDRQVLVTSDQPYTLGSNSRSLEIYRNVSKTYQFPAEEDTKESVGLPGRVFLEKLPEWTPDVRFFRSEEYPRIDHARQYNVRGSLAVPVFEQGSGTCLGVVEIITTSQMINYGPDIENVCRALEAVHLRSSQSFLPPSLKAHSELCQAALPRMLEVLKSACKIYRLPLALTWASCVYQGKEGCRHSNENYALCVSTVDSACFVADRQMQAFQEACSERHLIKGQGIVGRAFATKKPCYSSDITAFCKTEYPLSHHAMMFGLHCAIAIPAVSIYKGSADFVLEFFLPDDCKDNELRKHTLESLASAIHVAFQNSGFTTEKEFEEAVILHKEVGLDSEKPLQQGKGKKQISSHSKNPTIQESTWTPQMLETRGKGKKQIFSPSKDPTIEESTWTPQMLETRGKGSRASFTLDYRKEPEEKFNLTAQWESPRSESHHKQLNQNFWELEQNSHSGEGDSGSISFGADQSHSSKRTGGKKRTKTDKTISLEVLQQYFAGSLKDAAKSIGVCPTTLKRICRQHGITRWPSRKIKKVGHSLKKLQHVIDSVQGAQGSIKLSSFYSSFPELHPSKHLERGPTSLNPGEHSKQLSPEAANCVVSPCAGDLQNLSSCSQSSISATSSSTGAKQHSTAADACHGGDAVLSEDTCGLKRVRSDAELHASTQDETKLLVRSQSQKALSEHVPGGESGPPIPNNNRSNMHHGSTLKVKATYGEEKIRLSLQQNWSFTDLQNEIGRRFNIDDFTRIDLKYLDDDQEWVLLTCDADLEECVDICRTSQGDNIRINLVHATTLPNSHGVSPTPQPFSLSFRR